MKSYVVFAFNEDMLCIDFGLTSSKFKVTRHEINVKLVFCSISTWLGDFKSYWAIAISSGLTSLKDKVTRETNVILVLLAISKNFILEPVAYVKLHYIYRSYLIQLYTGNLK